MALALGALAGGPVSGVAVAIQLWLPEVMAAAYRSPFSMRPPDPMAVPGGGWLHADLGSAGDRDAFERLLTTLPPSATAEEVAAGAQEWRLAVCDYRARIEEPPACPLSFVPPAAAGTRPVPPRPGPVLRILDLTNMWAGPLATWLLQGLGAVVTKVEPSFRPDGFRALDGSGIHPGGRRCDPGRDSGMWNALNEGKGLIDLDLRRAADRDRFVALAADSDVVMDSFSPRVMPNFGLPLPDGPLYVSIPAFPQGPRRDWVAYGTGVHAISGLGDAGGGRFAAPAVSYPDPVAGFTTALGVMAAMTGRGRGLGVARVECPLHSSVQPLLSRTGGVTPRGPDADAAGRRLLALGGQFGLMEARPVCRVPLLHPRPMFDTKQNVF